MNEFVLINPCRSSLKCSLPRCSLPPRLFRRPESPSGNPGSTLGSPFFHSTQETPLIAIGSMLCTEEGHLQATIVWYCLSLVFLFSKSGSKSKGWNGSEKFSNTAPRLHVILPSTGLGKHSKPTNEWLMLDFRWCWRAREAHQHIFFGNLHFKSQSDEIFFKAKKRKKNLPGLPLFNVKM